MFSFEFKLKPKPPVQPREAENDARFHVRPHEKKEKEVTVESKAEAFVKAKELLAGRLEDRFSEDGVQPLEYHSPDHSYHAAHVTRQFLETVWRIDPELISADEISLTEIEALGHDIRQDAEPRDPKKMLQRKRGFNERASADEVLEGLGSFRYKNDEPVFPTEDQDFRSRIITDIETTVPSFEVASLPDGRKAIKVYQAGLTDRSSLSALALATADLRGEFITGRDPRNFVESGKAEFRETRIPIAEAIKKKIKWISPATRADMTKQILDWERLQPGFVEWQEVLFRESIEQNQALNASPKAEEIRAKLLSLFSGFEAGRKAVEAFSKQLCERYGKLQDAEEQERLMKAGDTSFEQLLKEMGYRF